MILRRVTEHVKAQNWTAIALDFVIVVIGVFAGVQLGNWNEARSERRDYEMALERYRGEIRTNLNILDTFDQEMSRALAIVTPAFDALLACDGSAEGREKVEQGLAGIVGTYGLKLRASALHDLTENQALLAQQTEAERALFSDTRHRFDVFLREAVFIELFPFEDSVFRNPIISIGERKNRTVSYAGADYSRPVRRLTLNSPFEEACKDDTLIKSFYSWERWQSVLPVVANLLRQELEKDLAALDARNETPEREPEKNR